MIVYVTSVWLGYKLYKLSSFKANDQKDGVILAVIMGGLLLMGLSVLDNYGAVYWFSGAMNYFWLTPFFLAALYAPLSIAINNKLPRKTWLVVSLIAGGLTAVSHEQFGIVLATILASLTIYQAIKNKKFNKIQVWLLAFMLLVVAGFVIHLVAPGNAIRLEEEVTAWLPDMYSVPLTVRLESDIRWFMDALLNQTGYLLPIIWGLLAVLLLKNPTRKIVDVVVAVCLAAAAGLGLFADKFMVFTAFLREFFPVWGFVGNIKDWIPIIIHVSILVLTIVAMWLAARTDRAKAIAPIVLSAAAVGTVGAVWVSPTMYSSIHRTLYVASVLLIIVIVILLNQVLSSSKSRR
jgi:hypothetical protein